MRKMSCDANTVLATIPLEAHSKAKAQFVESKDNAKCLVDTNALSANKDMCQSQFKGIYTWISAPKALYSTRDLTNATTIPPFGYLQ